MFRPLAPNRTWRWSSPATLRLIAKNFELARMTPLQEHSSLGGSGVGRHYELIRQSQRERRLLRIRYRSGQPAEGVTTRDVEVYACDGQYFDAYCRLREDKRTFRLDRVVDMELLEETFDV